MARSKSIPGNKAGRKQADPALAHTPVALPDGKTVAETALSEVKADNKTSDLRKKTEPQSRLVPINVEEEIRRRAYELYEQRGFSAGHATDDWLVAEHEVMQRYRQRSA
jgi:hypothetical protein